jgi:Putative lumazine-binding
METLTDHELVTQVALDYFEGWFDGDVARMDRALHTDLVKRSIEHDRVTTKAQMLEFTAAGEGRQDGVDRSLNIRIEDVCEDIASVTVESAVYHEYVHLMKTPDGWRIANALWRYT